MIIKITISDNEGNEVRESEWSFQSDFTRVEEFLGKVERHEEFCKHCGDILATDEFAPYCRPQCGEEDHEKSLEADDFDNTGATEGADR